MPAILSGAERGGIGEAPARWAEREDFALVI